MKSLFKTALAPHIARNALIISAVVGTVLNIINQSGVILSDEAISWPHLFMNYLVPYLVASYSAAKNQRSKQSD